MKWARLAVTACSALIVGSAHPQGVTTTTTSASVSFGPTAAIYVNSTLTVGPTTIATGNLGTCTLIAPPPVSGYGVCPVIGTGAAGSPLLPPCLGTCTLPGTPFTLLAGQRNVNTNTHTVIVQGLAVAQPVPLDPWVPFGGAISIALLAAFGRLRSRRA
ncbi:MAG: hypothetical protein ABI724_12385 [Betaproteobacteria bacterium]